MLNVPSGYFNLYRLLVRGDYRRGERAVWKQRRKKRKKGDRKQSKVKKVMISKDTSVKLGACIKKYKNKGMNEIAKAHQLACWIRSLE